MNKFMLCVFIVLFVMAYVVISQGDPFNPEDKINYESSTFYNNVPPDQWDWDFVIWEKVPATIISDVPPDKLQYSSLTSQQRNAMTSQQISVNFDRIKDLSSDVNFVKAQQAISERYDVDVDLSSAVGDSSKKVVLNDGILSTEFGMENHVDLKSGIYKKIKFEIIVSKYYTENGLIKAVLSSEITEIPIVSGDQFLIDATKKSFNYDGNSLQGQFKYNGKNLELVYETSAIINGVFLNSGSGGYPLHVFFDGERHADVYDSYVSMGPNKDNIIFNLHGGSSVEFLWENPFIYVEKGDKLFFEGPSGDTGLVEIKKRSFGEIDLIPLVTVEEGEIIMGNGKNRFKIGYENQEYKFKLTKIMGGGSGSVQLSLVHELSDWKVIFDDLGRYVVLDDKKEYPELECFVCSSDLDKNKDLLKVIYNGNAPDIEFSTRGYGTSSPSITVIAAFNKIINDAEAPPGLFEGVEISIAKTKDDLPFICSSQGALGCYSLGTVYIQESAIVQFDMPGSDGEHIIFHEIGHHHLSCHPWHPSGLCSTWDEVAGLQTGGKPTYGEKSKQSAFGVIMGGIAGVGDATRWDDGTRGPGYGFTGPYGSNSAAEDWAEHLSCAYSKECWTPLLDKDYEYQKTHFKKFMLQCGVAGGKKLIPIKTCNQMKVMIGR